jgi:hypothetical protein
MRATTKRMHSLFGLGSSHISLLPIPLIKGYVSSTVVYPTLLDAAHHIHLAQLTHFLINRRRPGMMIVTRLSSLF